MTRSEIPIRAWLASAGYPGVDVGEVTQRPFITAFTNLHRYEEGTDLKAWLLAVARFQVRTELATRRCSR